MALNDGLSNVRNWLFLAGIGLVVGLAGCKKHEVTEEPPETPPVATPAPSAPEPAPAAATPVPATPAPVVQVTSAPQLAPPGVFYLVSAVSIETNDGILGLKPGQLLRQVRPGVYRADTNEVTLRPEQVTNDMGLARRLMTQDEANQMALRQHLAAQAPPPPPSLGSTAPTASSQPQPSGVPAAAPQVDGKSAERNDLIRQQQILDQQIQQLYVSFNVFANKYGGQSLAAKRSPQAALIWNQITGLQKERADLMIKMGIH